MFLINRMFEKKANLLSSHQWNYIQSVENAMAQHETLEYFKAHHPQFNIKSIGILEDMLGITPFRKSGNIKDKPIVTIITHAGTTICDLNLDDYSNFYYFKKAIMKFENQKFDIDLFDLSKDTKIRHLCDIEPFTQIARVITKRTYVEYDWSFSRKPKKKEKQCFVNGCQICLTEGKQNCKFHKKHDHSTFCDVCKRRYSDKSFYYYTHHTYYPDVKSYNSAGFRVRWENGKCIVYTHVNRPQRCLYTDKYYDDESFDEIKNDGYEYWKVNDYHDDHFNTCEKYHIGIIQHQIFNDKIKSVLKEKRIKRIRKKKQNKKKQNESRQQNFYRKQRKKRKKSGKKKKSKNHCKVNVNV